MPSSFVASGTASRRSAHAKPLWFTGQATPDACEPLFAALIAKGELPIDDRRARVRLASESGNLRARAGDRGGFSAAEQDRRSRVRRDRPGRAARARARRVRMEVRCRAGARALRARARGAAATRTPRTPRGSNGATAFLPAPRVYGNARLAFHAARQLLPAANAWYREAGATPLTPEQHAWRVRAALRAQSWRDVLAAVDAMPERDSRTAAWRYWRARALAALGDRAARRRLFETLANEFNFYGLLAAEARGRGAEQMALLKRARDADARSARRASARGRRCGAR